MTDSAMRQPLKDGGALPEVNSRQLAAVRAVAEYRSFIAAAAYLGISQPALTLTIKRLEQTLGLPLFLRTTRHVTLTAAGREFVAMAERVLNDLKLGMQSLRELTEQQRGQVIVSSLIPIGMSGVIVEYGRRFPGVEIQLREGLQDDVRDDVRSGVADFGIGELGDLPDSHLTESLGVEELWVVLNDGHPLARQRQIEFSALKDIALVSFRVGSASRRPHRRRGDGRRVHVAPCRDGRPARHLDEPCGRRRRHIGCSSTRLAQGSLSQSGVASARAPSPFQRDRHHAPARPRIVAGLRQLACACARAAAHRPAPIIGRNLLHGVEPLPSSALGDSLVPSAISGRRGERFFSALPSLLGAALKGQLWSTAEISQLPGSASFTPATRQIGRASCRERV